MTDTTHEAPDWENFAKAVLTDWPTGDLDGSDLFDLSLQYGMIQEVPGGYNSDHHIDADCICPEEGDPWYEYTFRGKAGPGLYSITDMTRRIKELEAERNALAEENERLRKRVKDMSSDICIGRIRWEALAEIKATVDGKSDQPVADIISGCIAEVAAYRAILAELKGQGDEWKCPINYTGCTKNCGSYGCGN
jgi:hypothetical protein